MTITQTQRQIRPHQTMMMTMMLPPLPVNRLCPCSHQAASCARATWSLTLFSETTGCPGWSLKTCLPLNGQSSAVHAGQLPLSDKQTFNRQKGVRFLQDLVAAAVLTPHSADFPLQLLDFAHARSESETTTFHICQRQSQDSSPSPHNAPTWQINAFAPKPGWPQSPLPVQRRMLGTTSKSWWGTGRVVGETNPSQSMDTCTPGILESRSSRMAALIDEAGAMRDASTCLPQSPIEAHCTGSEVSAPERHQTQVRGAVKRRDGVRTPHCRTISHGILRLT